MRTRVISSRFHYKIKRYSAGEHKLKVKTLKVRLVVQEQQMSKDKGDFMDKMEGRRRRSYAWFHAF